MTNSFGLISNAAGITFENIPYTFWVEYDWNTKTIVENGEINAIQANEGGSLNYNIVIGETNIEEIETLTNGRYSKKDSFMDYEMTGLLTLIVEDNETYTYYWFDESGKVIDGMLKKIL